MPTDQPLNGDYRYDTIQSHRQASPRHICEAVRPLTEQRGAEAAVDGFVLSPPTDGQPTDRPTAARGTAISLTVMSSRHLPFCTALLAVFLNSVVTV